MPNPDDPIWCELARHAGECDAAKLDLLNLVYVSRMSLRWAKSAQDAYATEELSRMIEKLDRAAREVKRQAVFSIVSLGIGFGINAALLLSKGASLAPLLQGGVQLWTASGQVAGRTLQFSALGRSFSLVGTNAFYAAGYNLHQIIASQVPKVAILAAAKVDSSGDVGRGLADAQRWGRFSAAMSEYERALDRAMRRGFAAGASGDQQHMTVIRTAAANDQLNDLRERIAADLERIAQAHGGSASERRMLKLGALVDLWHGVWQWCEARIPAAARDYAAQIEQQLRRLRTLPFVVDDSMARLQDELTKARHPSLQLSGIPR